MLVNGIPITGAYRWRPFANLGWHAGGEHRAHRGDTRPRFGAVRCGCLCRRDQHHHQDCRRYRRHPTRLACRFVQQSRCLGAAWRHWRTGSMLLPICGWDTPTVSSRPSLQTLLSGTPFSPRAGAGQPRLRCHRWPHRPVAQQMAVACRLSAALQSAEPVQEWLRRWILSARIMANVSTPT